MKEKPEGLFLTVIVNSTYLKYKGKAVMNWQQVCENPRLRDLPYKIELNEREQIILSPARLSHGNYQFEIGRALFEVMQRQGRIVTECAIRTAKGTKVADVAWFSEERWNQVRHEYDSPVAPEICVEVISSANTDSEMREKKRLYFEVGAAEVWFCNEGRMSFYSKKRKRKHSALARKFPEKLPYEQQDRSCSLLLPLQDKSQIQKSFFSRNPSGMNVPAYSAAKSCAWRVFLKSGRNLQHNYCFLFIF